MANDPAQESETLQQQLAAPQRVLAMVPAMLAYWDVQQRCVFANQAYETWFGVKPAELIGRTMKELLGPIYPLNLPFIEGALRGERQEFEREIPDPAGGPPRYSQATYIPDIQNGVVRGFSVLVADISARKRVEDELRLAKQAAEDALAQVKTLKGLLPICAWCRKIRDPRGYWDELEKFVAHNTDAIVTHGMCEDCASKHFSADQQTDD